MEDVQVLDSRFYLRLRVPSLANDLFPALFACNYDAEKQKARGYSWSDMATFSGSDSDVDNDEPISWDITWDWEENFDAAVLDEHASIKSAESQDEQVECGTIVSTESSHALQSIGERSQQDTMDEVGVLCEYDAFSKCQRRTNRRWDPGG